MKRCGILTLFLCLLFLSCQKETPLVHVTYRVTELSSASPTYTITYTSDKSGGTTVNSSSSSSWDSGTIDLEAGQFVSMRVDCHDPTFDLRYSIYTGAVIFAEGRIQSPNPSGTVSGNLGQ